MRGGGSSPGGLRWTQAPPPGARSQEPGADDACEPDTDGLRRTTPMTDTQTFEPEGRAIPFVDEGDGPVKLVLIQERDVAADVLGVVAHYLAEEAGFHVLRIGHRAEGKHDEATLAARVDDALAVI